MPLSGFDLRPIQISDFDENDWNRVMENIKSLDPLLYSHLTHQKYIRIK